MELTLELDDYVYDLLKAEAHRSGESIEETVNRLLRAALMPALEVGMKAADNPGSLSEPSRSSYSR